MTWQWFDHQVIRPCALVRTTWSKLIAAAAATISAAQASQMCQKLIEEAAQLKVHMAANPVNENQFYVHLKECKNFLEVLTNLPEKDEKRTKMNELFEDVKEVGNEAFPEGLFKEFAEWLDVQWTKEYNDDDDDETTSKNLYALTDPNPETFSKLGMRGLTDYSLIKYVFRRLDLFGVKRGMRHPYNKKK